MYDYGVNQDLAPARGVHRVPHSGDPERAWHRPRIACCVYNGKKESSQRLGLGGIQYERQQPPVSEALLSVIRPGFHLRGILGPSRFMRLYRPPIRFERRDNGCDGGRYSSGDAAGNAHAETIPAGKLSAHRASSDSWEVRSNGCLESRRLSSASGITIPSKGHSVGELTLPGCAASRAQYSTLPRYALIR
jgi:hypothetical protein